MAEQRGPACALICARAQAIAAAREAESVHLRRFAQLKAFSLLTGLVTPIVSLALTFVAYAWLHGGPPSVADSFTALALFKLLVLPFKSFVEPAGPLQPSSPWRPAASRGHCCPRGLRAL